MVHRVVVGAALAAAIVLPASRSVAASDSRAADAAEQRSRPALVALLRKGVDVNGRQADGATALQWAAHWDDVDSAEGLIKAGANPNIANDYGVTPLFLAAENGSATMIGVLVHAGANVNAALPGGQTVLMTAARTGNVPAVEALLAAGAAIDAAQTSKQQTALMWAIAEHHGGVAQALIAHGADIRARTASGFTALLFAAREGDVDTGRLLFARGADVNESSADGSTPLLVATVRGHVGFALVLLERGARADGNAPVAGVTPLHWAATTLETTQITYAGLAAPGEWDAIGGIPDRAAKIVLLKALLAHGADVNARITKRLLVQAPPGGGQFVSQPGAGATPFLAAAGSADAEVMRLLAANGADPALRSTAGETPLMMTAAADVDISYKLTEPKRLDAMRLAWELGNDVEAADDKGHRAMHLAARSGLHDLIRFLLDHGADLNPLTRTRTETRTAGQAQQFVEAQTPLGLVEGTIYINFFERPATAAFLRTLGAKSVGRYDLNAPPPVPAAVNK